MSNIPYDAVQHCTRSLAIYGCYHCIPGEILSIFMQDNFRSFTGYQISGKEKELLKTDLSSPYTGFDIIVT